ncbi:MAG: hypothetical protein AAB917_00100 [Patescibacteria group bacterium]
MKNTPIPNDLQAGVIQPVSVKDVAEQSTLQIENIQQTPIKAPDALLTGTTQPVVYTTPIKEPAGWGTLEILTLIGVGTLILGLIHIGRKLQILDSLQTTSDKIKINMNVICNYLIKNHDSFNSIELETFSPFQLTPKGKVFISSLGFDNIFEKNKKEFFDFIDSENPTLKYDVENSSIKAIAALYGKDFMKFLKVYFYNNPTRNIENTAPTLGVYVRDKYLEAHPEITE